MTEEDNLEKEIEVLEMEISDLKSANETLFVVLSDIFATSERTTAVQTKKEITEKGINYASLWRILYDDYEKCHNAEYDISDEMIYNLKKRIIRIISETADVVEEHRKKSWENGYPQEIGKIIKDNTQKTMSWLISFVKLVRKPK